jgi:flavorubredoxin
MMTVTNAESGTNVHEIAPSIFRVSTPVAPNPSLPGGFTFNQFLIVDDEPLLFHTGLRAMFPLVRQAVQHVLGDVAKLRHVGFSHFESDECGALNEWLAVAPHAQPVCSVVGAMVSVNDFAARPARALADGEELVLGERKLRWLDAPNLPHNWECGYMFESTTRTLLCGDLFTHAGDRVAPITEQEVLGPAEAMRMAMPSSVAVDRSARAILDKLAATEPTVLALMHGSSYRGNGAALLRALGDALEA